MKSNMFRRAAYAVIGLSLAFVFLAVQRTSSGTPVVRAASAVAAPVAAAPTLTRYNCGEAAHPDYITFNWTGTRPQNGWVGEVTYGGFIKKPIQVYDAKPDPNNNKIVDWAYQAQDGSFVCRMIVDSSLPLLRKANVSFGSCRNNNWPQLFCSLKGD